MSLLSPTPTVYAGSVLTLSCDIQLRTEVDSEISIAVTWTRNGMVLNDTALRMMSDTVEQSSSLYLSQLVFNPLQIGLDDGVYMCEADVVSNVEFVLSSTSQSNNVSLHVTGMKSFVRYIIDSLVLLQLCVYSLIHPPNLPSPSP